MEKLGHGRPAGRRPGQRPREPAGRHPVERRPRPATQPIAFVGKGVSFDTGGISIKPADGMEDMKWDMGGAAAVAGLMHALAGRKAKVNAVGILGLVENMPDGNAQRPGDVVTSMSGQTIEVHQHRRRGPPRAGRRPLVHARTASSRSSWSIWPP